MTGKPDTTEPAAPTNRHLLAEDMGLCEKAKDAKDSEPNVAPTDYGGTDEVLSDEDFATLDADGDGVVHLCAEAMKGNYPPAAPEGRRAKEAPAEPEAKARKAAPENK